MDGDDRAPEEVAHRSLNILYYVTVPCINSPNPLP